MRIGLLFIQILLVGSNVFAENSGDLLWREESVKGYPEPQIRLNFIIPNLQSTYSEIKTQVDKNGLQANYEEEFLKKRCPARVVATLQSLRHWDGNLDSPMGCYSYAARIYWWRVGLAAEKLGINRISDPFALLCLFYTLGRSGGVQTDRMLEVLDRLLVVDSKNPLAFVLAAEFSYSAWASQLAKKKDGKFYLFHLKRIWLDATNRFPKLEFPKSIQQAVNEDNPKPTAKFRLEIVHSGKFPGPDSELVELGSLISSLDFDAGEK